MDRSLPAGLVFPSMEPGYSIISSLVTDTKQSPFRWSSRVQAERDQHHHHPHHHHQEQHHQQEQSGGNGKRVTWDELVSVRRFEAYSEELTASYPRHYPYKHGSTRQQQQQQLPSFH